MYEIEHKDFEEYTLVKIYNKKKGISFSFFPDFGAMLNQVVLKDKNAKIHSLLWESKDYENLITEGKSVYKGSQLFPFPNRINNGTYVFGKEEFQLDINFPKEGHAIHGLVAESEFKITDTLLTEEEGSVTVEYDYHGEEAGYPFEFHLQIVFRLSESGFSCETLVKNTDSREIPVGDGWHPYFKLENKMEEVLICIPSKEEIEVNERMIPTGKIKVNNEISELKKIGSREFDTCFKLAQARESTVKVMDGDKHVNVWMESDIDQYQYVQVYIPPARDCIAIEPMTCLPDAFNNKKGLIVIPAGKTRSFLWGIKLT